MDYKIQIKTEKIEWINEMKNEIVITDMDATNTEQKKLARKVKEALYFLENFQISNKESLDNIKKPLDDLLHSLKYLPVEQGKCFNDLPTEIKKKILDYSCDSGAFVAASVCQEWKSILETRLYSLMLNAYISISKCCFTDDGYGQTYYSDSCDYGACFMPEEKLKASVDLGMDIPLAICYPVTDLDSKLVVDGLMSASSFKIMDGCPCGEGVDGPVLSRGQTEDLFEAMEKKTEIDSVDLQGLDMTHLDQDKLIDCFFKIKNLTLAGTVNGMGDRVPFMDFERFVEKLSQASIDSTSFKLSSLHLSYIGLHNPPYHQSFYVDLANALCNVKRVTFGPSFPLMKTTIKQIIRNVTEGGIRMKSLLLTAEEFDWSNELTPIDLITLVIKLEQFQWSGSFSQEQVDAVSWLPGVKADLSRITKGII